MNPEQLDLEAYIARLLAFLERVASPLPEWREIKVLDTSDRRVKYRPGPAPNWHVPASTLYPLHRFAPRFAELLSAGYSWINLSAYGIYNGDLIVGIELPRQPTGVPPGYTSVNYSGPALDPSGQRQWSLPLVVISRQSK